MIVIKKCIQEKKEELICKSRSICQKAALVTVPLMCGLAPAVVFAEEPTSGTGSSATVAAMETAFSGIQSDFMALVAKIAPIGLSIAGVFILWRLGMKFYTQISNKGTGN